MKAGVREYWIVDPQTKMVRVCTLNNGNYDSIDYLGAEKIAVNVLEGCEIDIKRVFADLDADGAS
jgi:Uma2 family endonuclease